MASSPVCASVTNIATVSEGKLTALRDVTTRCEPTVSSVGFNGPSGDLRFLARNRSTANSERTKSNDDSHDPSGEFKGPDGGWGWMVTFASFMHNFLLDGVTYTFGIFFDDFLEHFGGTKGKTQVLSSVISGTYLLIGPLVGVIERRFGCRRVAIVGSVIASLGLFLSTFSPNLDVMILLYGIVGGAGFGLVYEPSILMVSYYFNRRRSLATGVAVCGSGIGGFAFAPLSVLLLDLYGWQGAMWIIAAIVLNGVVFAAFYRPTQTTIQSPQRHTALQEQNDNVDGPKCTSLRQTLGLSMLSSPSMVVYLVSCFLVSAGFYIPLNFLPSFAKELELTAAEGSLLISIIGIFNTLLRVVIGLVSDRPWADCILINGVTVVLGGVATFCIPYYTMFGVLVVYSVVFGSVIGIFVPLKSIILIELKGIQSLSTGFGLQSLIIGFAVVIGSPIAGFLSDVTGDYDVVFYLAGVTIALGGSLCLCIRRVVRWEQTIHNRHRDTDGSSETHTYTENTYKHDVIQNHAGDSTIDTYM